MDAAHFFLRLLLKSSPLKMMTFTPKEKGHFCCWTMCRILHKTETSKSLSNGVEEQEKKDKTKQRILQWKLHVLMQSFVC